jgi:Poxvirus A32 protein
MVELKLRKFDVNRIKDDKIVVMLGRRGSGKSVILKEILSKHTAIPLGICISPTEAANQYFGDFIPGMFIHHEYAPKVTDNFVRRQQAAMETMNKEVTNFGASNIDPRAFLIMDDCMYDASWTKDKNMRYLFFNGRHVKAFVLMTMQYVYGMPPTMRSNIDFVFLLREPNLQNRKRIFEAYAGMFHNFDLFNTVMDQCTNNFECLVIDNTTRSNRLEDQVYWYKAPESPGSFKMCNPQYWALDRQCRKQDGDDTEEIFDLDKLRKTAKISIKVVKS